MSALNSKVMLINTSFFSQYKKIFLLRLLSYTIWQRENTKGKNIRPFTVIRIHFGPSSSARSYLQLFRSIRSRSEPFAVWMHQFQTRLVNWIPSWLSAHNVLWLICTKTCSIAINYHFWFYISNPVLNGKLWTET
jgi:hypothetical protein